MSIGSATSAPNPALLALLSQLTGTQSGNDGEPDFPVSASSSGAGAPANNQITGSGTAAISSQVLNVLMQMQQQLGDTSGATTTTTTQPSTSTMANAMRGGHHHRHHHVGGGDQAAATLAPDADDGESDTLLPSASGE